MTDISTMIGMQSITAILVHITCMAITWWALQAVDMTKVMKKNKVAQIQAIYIILTIVIGSALGNFLLTYFQYSQNISNLF